MAADKLGEAFHKLGEALATRRVVERAKRLLMQKGTNSEAEALQHLQRLSIKTGMPLKKVAEGLVYAAGDSEQ